MPVEHFIGCLLQDFFWHGGWAGGEIEHAHLEIPEIRFGRRELRGKCSEDRAITVFAPEKEMAACARAQTAIIALS
ncbi:hypothetical protein QCE58_11580 [Caballeronia sp. LZ028]|nr:hypothetical protein [Caballeronia sp. LZ028]